MPFTFAHPAAILPIKSKWKKYFSFTGLILGSMAPDFEYFLHFKPFSTIGHCFSGFIFLDLPLCFVIAYIFHNIIKKPFINHCFSPLDQWYWYISEKRWNLNSIKKIIIFTYSCILGMITHVLWDGFTHTNGYFVTLIPLLNRKIQFINISFPIYKLLQHFSTFLGLIAILIFLYFKRDTSSIIFKKKNVSKLTSKRKFIYHLIPLCIGILFILISIYINFINLGLKPIGNSVVTFINGLFFGYIIVSFYSDKLGTVH
ncbi:DUF4184 family protein [Haloimpatiens lingqiaonensis]|uniref:DUF4184 family protein n=1 Tax=Haloimpatiens lingqiaonensis TaxID=1380675 RepID=UPI0010FF6128|nr:DUF4184 family protein [Haloimpatiens lingqiaonensis]